jgi:predicted nuclease of restriction endonuclease-like (RecB) superfamily
MKFEQLVAIIEQTSKRFQKKALSSIEQLLVIRNWLIGFYLVEFEQRGEDRAKYGTLLLKSIASELKKKNLKGFSLTNLNIFRQFYLIYPQIIQTVSEQLKQEIIKAVPELLQIPILQTLSEKSKDIINRRMPEPYKQEKIGTKSELLIEHLSFSHFTELIKIKDPLKRTFYEREAIKGHWGVRHLKRQIDSLLLERIGLSKNKKVLLESIRDETSIARIEDTIKDPYVLEFTGFKELPEYSESDLEKALLNKIQDFLIELGNGFCFEARQKRITIENEHDRVDLVFYHRILKCHILIELKARAFSPADVGQMNFYLNYFRERIMEDGDNPPVGIILCTDKKEIKVEYTTAGMDNKMFVSKYMVELPGREELKKLLIKFSEEIG